MPLYVLKRVGLALVTLVLLSLIIFFAGQVLPGNAGRAILGPFASQQAVIALDHKLGVDRPLIVQYWSWATGILRGNLGHVLPATSAGQLVHLPLHRALAQACGIRLCDRRTA